MVAYYKAVNDHNRVAFADRAAGCPRRPTRRATSASTSARRATPAPRAGVERDDATRRPTRRSRRSSRSSTSSASAATSPATSKPGGSTVTHVDRLQDVQCEVCHGPGSKHAAKPTDRSRIIARAGAVGCLQCHHPPHVERFDAAARMKDILGPGHGLPMK